jgi:hypothetical protein
VNRGEWGLTLSYKLYIFNKTNNAARADPRRQSLSLPTRHCRQSPEGSRITSGARAAEPRADVSGSRSRDALPPSRRAGLALGPPPLPLRPADGDAGQRCVKRCAAARRTAAGPGTGRAGGRARRRARRAPRASSFCLSSFFFRFRVFLAFVVGPGLYPSTVTTWLSGLSGTLRFLIVVTKHKRLAVTSQRALPVQHVWQILEP